MTYGRSAPGPWATLVLVAIATALFIFDRHRLKRARQRNLEGRCARCGAFLVGTPHRAPVAGGPRFVSTAFVCDACHRRVKVAEWVIWVLLAAAIVVVLFLEWKRTHP
jgi:hypothetical protein